MYGALEVFSKSALGAYLSAHQRRDVRLADAAWSNDLLMCGGDLGVLSTQS